MGLQAPAAVHGAAMGAGYSHPGALSAPPSTAAASGHPRPAFPATNAAAHVGVGGGGVSGVSVGAGAVSSGGGGAAAVPSAAAVAGGGHGGGGVLRSSPPRPNGVASDGYAASGVGVGVGGGVAVDIALAAPPSSSGSGGGGGFGAVGVIGVGVGGSLPPAAPTYSTSAGGSSSSVVPGPVSPAGYHAMVPRPLSFGAPPGPVPFGSNAASLPHHATAPPQTLHQQHHPAQHQHQHHHQLQHQSVPQHQALSASPPAAVGHSGPVAVQPLAPVTALTAMTVHGGVGASGSGSGGVGVVGGSGSSGGGGSAGGHALAAGALGGRPFPVVGVHGSAGGMAGPAVVPGPGDGMTAEQRRARAAQLTAMSRKENAGNVQAVCGKRPRAEGGSGDADATS